MLNVEPVDEEPEELFQWNASCRDIRRGKVLVPDDGCGPEMEMRVRDGATPLWVPLKG